MGPESMAGTRLRGQRGGTTSQTVMTTLPWAWPASKCPIASATSLIAYCALMTGVTFPDSMSCFRTIRSSLLSV